MKLRHRKLPPFERLNQLLRVDDDGTLRWKINYSSVHAGVIAGKQKAGRYLHVGIDHSVYLVHRVVWAITYREDPGDQKIDHIDGNTRNNHPSNLRVASCSENNCNARMRRDNSSGIKGVQRHSKSGKWQACVRKDKKTHYLGLFDDPEDARQVVEECRAKLHGEFARTA